MESMRSGKFGIEFWKSCNFLIETSIHAKLRFVTSFVAEIEVDGMILCKNGIETWFLAACVLEHTMSTEMTLGMVLSTE
jgi:hypothetical protein